MNAFFYHPRSIPRALTLFLTLLILVRPQHPKPADFELESCSGDGSESGNGKREHSLALPFPPSSPSLSLFSYRRDPKPAQPLNASLGHRLEWRQDGFGGALRLQRPCRGVVSSSFLAHSRLIARPMSQSSPLGLLSRAFLFHLRFRGFALFSLYQGPPLSHVDGNTSHSLPCLVLSHPSLPTLVFLLLAQAQSPFFSKHTISFER